MTAGTEWQEYGSYPSPGAADTFLVRDVSATPPSAGTLKQVTAAALATTFPSLAGLNFNVLSPSFAGGADPSGADDSTAAQQAAISAAAAYGGNVWYPPGSYKTTPVSATVPALTVPSNVTLAGAGRGASVILKNGDGPLIDFSGAGPVSQTQDWNIYQGLRDLAIDGGGFSGLLLRLYYVQSYYEENVYLFNGADVFVDMAQCYDSRVTNGLYLNGGSAGASAVSGAQAVTHLIRNSAAPATTLSAGISGTVTALPVAALPAALPAGVVQVWNAAGQVQNFTTTGAAAEATSVPVTSVAAAYTFASGDAVNGFGWSGDSTNDLVMRGCHWEDGLSGAIWITPGVDNSSQLNSVYILGSKIEQDNIGYDAPIVQVDPGTSDIQIDHMYHFGGGFAAGYSTPVAGFYFHPDFGAISNLFQSNGAAVTSTGIDAGTATGNNITLTNIYQYWADSPTVAGFNGSAGTTYLINFQMTGTVTSQYFTGTYTLINDGSGDWEFTGTGVIGALESYGLASFNAGTDTSGTATASSPSFTSGTAKQLSTTQDVMLYITVITSTSMTLAIGPTSTPANTIFTSKSPPVNTVLTFRIPKGWYVKITATITDYSFLQVTC